MNSSIFKLVLCVISVAIFACGGDSSVRDSARESIGGSDPTLSAPSTDPGMMANTAAGSSVMHYICPKNCAGSGGAGAGTCPVCGSEYIHNQAFHAQSQTPPPAEGGVNTATFQGGTGATGTPDLTSITPPMTEPAQNAAGVWHYTCTKGCAGGSGSAAACATCGATLVHNTAYHQ